MTPPLLPDDGAPQEEGTCFYCGEPLSDCPDEDACPQNPDNDEPTDLECFI